MHRNMCFPQYLFFIAFFLGVPALQASTVSQSVRRGASLAGRAGQRLPRPQFLSRAQPYSTNIAQVEPSTTYAKPYRPIFKVDPIKPIPADIGVRNVSVASETTSAFKFNPMKPARNNAEMRFFRELEEKTTDPTMKAYYHQRIEELESGIVKSDYERYLESERKKSWWARILGYFSSPSIKPSIDGIKQQK